MIDLIIVLSQFVLFFCVDIELPWHGSLEVIPDTFVYYDISSYSPGDTITFNITMKYFGSFSRRDCYNFQIDQVPTKDPHDSYYRKNLRRVSNKNVSYSGHFGTFTWNEIKQSGNHYIFIILPAPYFDFYSFWKYKIKIENPGISVAAIIGITIGCAVFISIAIIIIIYCIRRKRFLKLVRDINNNATFYNQYTAEKNDYQNKPILYSQQYNNSSVDCPTPLQNNNSNGGQDFYSAEPKYPSTFA